MGSVAGVVVGGGGTDGWMEIGEDDSLQQGPALPESLAYNLKAVRISSRPVADPDWF